MLPYFKSRSSIKLMERRKEEDSRLNWKLLKGTVILMVDSYMRHARCTQQMTWHNLLKAENICVSNMYILYLFWMNPKSSLRQNARLPISWKKKIILQFLVKDGRKTMKNGPCFCDPTKQSLSAFGLNIEFSLHIVPGIISNQIMNYMTNQRFLLIFVK